MLQKEASPDPGERERMTERARVRGRVKRQRTPEKAPPPAKGGKNGTRRSQGGRQTLRDS